MFTMSIYFIGFCYGSSWKNWRNLANFARKYSLLFIPSVGPGYDGEYLFNCTLHWFLSLRFFNIWIIFLLII